MLKSRVTSHVLLLGLIILAIALLYAKVSGAWFCGYDDFSEAHRAAFEDSANPMRIFTTTHNMHFMYRPVTSGLQYLTWSAFHHSPLAFRLRNLVMHLISVALLYGIVWRIAGSQPAAGGAALLFGLQPMANETVVVAIWTNATAYALALGSFFFFLLSLNSLKNGRAWKLWLLASLLCAFVSIFTYEPTIAIFAIMGAYLYVWRALSAPVTRGYLAAFLAGIAVELLVFFSVRHLVITQAAPLNPLPWIARNAAMYCVALLLPVDFVFGNAVLGTPLPSQLDIDPALMLRPAAAIAAVLLLLSVLFVRSRFIRSRVSRINKPLFLFLGTAITVAALPLLLFKSHASEHDLYLSAAFYCAAMCIIASQIVRSRVIYGVIVASLAVSFTLGTWTRNERVISCATIAHAILTQLPVSRWKEGDWHIRLATQPGEQLGEPYGAYNDYGLNTLETKMGATPGAKDAIQLATGNTHIDVDIVRGTLTARSCVRPITCFWVSRFGDVRNAVLAGPSQGELGENRHE